MRIDFFTNRTFCEQNQKSDRFSVGWICSEIKLPVCVTLVHLCRLMIPEKNVGSKQARPIVGPMELLVRFVKISMRKLYSKNFETLNR